MQLLRTPPYKGVGLGQGRQMAPVTIGRTPVSVAAPCGTGVRPSGFALSESLSSVKDRSVKAQVASADRVACADSNTSIIIDNDEDPEYTVVTVSAESRSGLLTALTVRSNQTFLPSSNLILCI